MGTHERVEVDVNHITLHNEARYIVRRTALQAHYSIDISNFHWQLPLSDEYLCKKDILLGEG